MENKATQTHENAFNNVIIDYDDLILDHVFMEPSANCASNNCFGCINDSGDDNDCCCDSR